MSLLESFHASDNRLARMCFTVCAGALFLTAITVVGPLAAQADCSAELSFDDVHLLNDGISDTAGPFAVDLEAGTYTIVTESSDDHDAQVGIGTQADERFHLVLDSGYRSPATNDIADDENDITTVFTDQVIDASTSLTLEHARIGGVNSVYASSVCFIQESAAPVVDDCAAADADVAPAGDVDAAVEAAVDGDAADAGGEDVDAGADAANAGAAMLPMLALPMTVPSPKRLLLTSLPQLMTAMR